MHNFISENIPPLTEKDLECLAELEKMTDDDIDYSDIPEITHEEFMRMLENTRRRRALKRANRQPLKQAV